MLVRRSWLDLHFILVAFLLLLFLVLVLSFALLNRRLKRGRARLTFKQRLPGLTFLIALVAIIATQRGMITVAGAILTPERVAALAALIVLLRVFDLIGEPTGRVFSTEMARNPGAITRSMLVMPWLIAVLCPRFCLSRFLRLRDIFMRGATTPRCRSCHGSFWPAPCD